jgi:hypothetical protein
MFCSARVASLLMDVCCAILYRLLFGT